MEKKIGFWNRVVDELDYQCKPRKWLAAELNIDVSTIGCGTKSGAIPRADIAIKVSKLLKVPLEYLVFGKNLTQPEMDIRLFNKYEESFKEMERLPDELKKTILDMVHKLAEPR